MKLGAENRNKVIAAIALVIVAVILMATRFPGVIGLGSSGSSSPATVSVSANSLPSAAAPARTPGRTNRAPARKQAPGQSLDPTLRTDLLKYSEDTKYEGTGRNIFRVFVEIPKVITPPVQPQPSVADNQPPLPPPPPPIELKYYGFATPAGGMKRIFLAQGEDVFIAKEGDIVDRRYKVVRISPNAVEILDVLSNNRQSIPLTQG
ncbi:MAG TPA: hypothetical protein VJO35_17555 [Terriglobales bacterium]|nr:hypothetical protein [Terriglobales bacterium]